MAEYTFSDTTGAIDLRAKATFRAMPHRSIGVEPAASNTVTVEITLADDPTSGSAVWYAWDTGPVTVATMDVLYAACTGIRARRTAGVAAGNKLIIFPT